ncbi:hypothetical protein ACOKFD_16260 [Flagellimonas sp. S174]|uniref:hypothetical protein n=1 Tax=Flagellimonas sp. S174 TaxID=3410790 RepID=UPI003BF50D5A
MLTKEILNSLLVQFGVSALVFGIGVFILKKVVTNLIKLKVDETFERKKLLLEVNKERQLNKFKKTDEIYPKVLETTYRLRNQVRRVVEQVVAEKIENYDSKYTETSFWGVDMTTMTQQVINLEEHLYVYKAFLDKSTFYKLHDFKNLVYQVEDQVNELKLLVNSNATDLLTINPKIEELNKAFKKANNFFLAIDNQIINRVS